MELKKYRLIPALAILLTALAGLSYYVFAYIPPVTYTPDQYADCATEPGDYRFDRRCCGSVTNIAGFKKPDGTCDCAARTLWEKHKNTCVGALRCAPCGNGVCEPQYQEDSCNCPADCE